MLELLRDTPISQILWWKAWKIL